MNTLFPTDHLYPEGFLYLPDFLTVEEETELIYDISNIELHNMVFHGYTANRKTASFGYDYSFDKRGLSKGKHIPVVFNFLIEKVSRQISVLPEKFAELLVTEYPAGSVINWHRDAPPFGLIAGISLATDCIFRLRPHDKAKQHRKSVISLPVKRRSLYVMKDAARSEWQHSISPVKQTRYSITLRTLNQQAK